MSNQPTDAELELMETHREYWVTQAESLTRLEENEDFKKVILEGFFKDRSIDQVSLLSTEHIKRKGLRPEVMENLVAISNLQQHFMAIKQLGAIEEQDQGFEDEGLDISDVGEISTSESIG